MWYETDAAPFVDEPEGYPRVTGEEGTPLSYVVLASADLRSWGGKPGMATMGLLLRNGTVFNGGSDCRLFLTAIQFPSGTRNHPREAL
jgi:hypothetical protein